MGSNNSSTKMDLESANKFKKVNIAPLPRTNNYRYYCGSHADPVRSTEKKPGMRKPKRFKNTLDNDKTIARGGIIGGSTETNRHQGQRSSGLAYNRTGSTGSRGKRDMRIQDIVKRARSDPIIMYRLDSRDSQSDDSLFDKDELQGMVADILGKILDERFVRSERMKASERGLTRVEETAMLEGKHRIIQRNREINSKEDKKLNKE